MSRPPIDRTAFVVALPGEARSLARLPALGQTLRRDGSRVLLGGMGPARAEDAARRAIAQGATGLVSWGVAAALTAGYGPGDLVLADEIVAADGRRLAVDPDWRDAIATHLSPDIIVADVGLAETPTVLADKAAKAALYAQTGAVAGDMESAAIARVAAANGAAFLAVRVILDDLDMVLPAAARAAMDETGHLQPVALTRAIIGGPRRMHAQLRELKHLAVAFRAARTTLTTAATAFSRDIAA